MVQVGEDIALVEHEANLPRIDRPEHSRHHESPLEAAREQQLQAATARERDRPGGVGGVQSSALRRNRPSKLVRVLCNGHF